MLSTTLRALVIIALLVGTVRAWRDGRLGARERRVLALFTGTLVILVAALLLWASRQPAG